MSVFYLDSSGVVKRYVNETGSTWVSGLLSPTSGNLVYVARITGVEVVSAIARRTRGGGLSPADAALALAQFRAEWPILYRTVEIVTPLANSATVLAEKYGLRAYDAIQLAAAVQIHLAFRAAAVPLTLVSADAELNRA